MHTETLLLDEIEKQRVGAGRGVSSGLLRAQRGRSSRKSSASVGPERKDTSEGFN